MRGIIYDTVIRRVDAYRVVLYLTGPWRDLLRRSPRRGVLHRHGPHVARPEPHGEALLLRKLDTQIKGLVQRQTVRAALHPDISAHGLLLAIVHLRIQQEFLQHGGRAVRALRRHFRRHRDPQLTGEPVILIGHIRQTGGYAVLPGDSGRAVIYLPRTAHSAAGYVRLQLLDQLPQGVQRLRVPCAINRRLPPAGAGQEAHGDDRRRDGQQHRRPDSRFLSVHGILHPFLYRHLAEGQRAHRRRTLPHGAGHQCPGIGGAPRAVHAPQHPLVTGVFHVPPQQNIRRPQHRVEPVQRQQQKSQRLYDVVAPPDVAPLMGQHLRQRRVVHALRHVDAGTEQPQHKGRSPRAAAVHVVLQPHRRAYPAVDAQIADQHICQHHHHARQPDRRQQRHGHHRFDRRYGLRRHDFRRRQRCHRLHRTAGQHLVRFLRRLLCLGQLVQRRRHRALRRL